MWRGWITNTLPFAREASVIRQVLIIALVGVALLAAWGVGHLSAQEVVSDNRSLEERVASLEQRIASLEMNALPPIDRTYDGHGILSVNPQYSFDLVCDSYFDGADGFNNPFMGASVALVCARLPTGTLR